MLYEEYFSTKTRKWDYFVHFLSNFMYLRHWINAKYIGCIKVHSLLEYSCAILISFKIMVIFNITSAEFVLMSADVVLKEMRIVPQRSKSE